MLDIDLLENGVATVTLNRPDVHNAFNAELIAGLTHAFVDLGKRDDIRAIVLAGAGKSFSAGADLNWMQAAANYDYEQNLDDAMRLSEMLDTLYECPKPVAAIAHGAVMGGGTGLLSCADFVVAVEGTRFAFSEVKLGLTPATISPFVVAAIGARQARRLFTSGERFDTALARRIGLVHDVAADMEAAQKAVEAWVSHCLDAAPGAMADAKALVSFVASKEINDELREETAERIAYRRASDEGKEGLAAFLEKRSPSWKGDA